MATVNYKTSSLLYDDSSKYLTEIVGEVFVCDEDGDERLAGKCRFFLADVENADVDVGYLLDLHGETVIYTALYDFDTAQFTDDFMSVIGCELFSSNLLILDRLEILPRYRGHRLASQIIDETIRLFSPNTEVAVLKAYPLQHEDPDFSVEREWREEMMLNHLEPDQHKATARLVRYYESLGFRSVGFDNIMVKPLCLMG